MKTLTFESPQTDKPVKWIVVTPEQAKANTLAYRLAGLEGHVDPAEITSLVQQALAAVGYDLYVFDAVPELTAHNEFGRVAGLGWRVATKGTDGLLEARLLLAYPCGWQVEVLAQPITHPLALHLIQALSLQVVQEVNAGKLPPPDSPFTPAAWVKVNEKGEPVVMPKEAPPTASLLTQADKDRIDIEDAKARATAAGFTVDE